jgi:hypothetical protein
LNWSRGGSYLEKFQNCEGDYLGRVAEVNALDVGSLLYFPLVKCIDKFKVQRRPFGVPAVELLENDDA